MARTGRPQIKIDWDQFDKLCGLQCTLNEISSWFDCSEDTIERSVKREKGITFAEYFEQKASKGKVSLRRKQYELAMAGDRVMLIWLGKQYLKQSDKLDKTETSTVTHMSGKSEAEIDKRIEEILKKSK